MTEYVFPRSVEEAIGLLETHAGEARIIAGGTDVMADVRQHKIRPRCLVDITRIPGLDRIEIKEDFIEIGAAVTFAAIKDSPVLNGHVHALIDAARSVGAVGIQSAATWVGNIVQAMPAADGAIIAVALEAEARVVSRSGGAWRAVETLFKGPGASAIDPTRQVVTKMRFPRPRSPWGTAWQRVGRRASLVLPVLNCAVSLHLDPGSTNGPGRGGVGIAHAAIALGPVAPHPLRMREAEAFLRGRPATADVFLEAARIAQEASNPRSSVMRASREYRLANIPPLVSEALRVATNRATDAAV
jgi:CO/xanthine dehydrogenase FAD-binding subunit